MPPLRGLGCDEPFCVFPQRCDTQNPSLQESLHPKEEFDGGKRRSKLRLYDKASLLAPIRSGILPSIIL